MQAPKDLNTLFAALREAKILVGPREVLRIHEILSRAENLDANGLRSILAAVLIKSREEKQRFDDLFRAFLLVQEDKLADRPENSPTKKIDSNPPNPVEPDKPGSKPVIENRSSRRTLGLLASVVVASLGGAYIAAEYLRGDASVVTGIASSSAIVDAAVAPVIPRRDADVASDSGAEEQQFDAGLAAPRMNDGETDASIDLTITEPQVVADTRSFPTYVPRIDVERQSFLTSSSGAMIGLGILAIALGLIVSRWGLRHKILPPRAPTPTRSGPRELPLSSPLPRDLELLDMQSEDALVWGIGRFVTEEFTTNLDVEKSVLATVAAGGRSELRFERRGRHRQVCLWIDESAKDPAIERLGREVALALSRVGLDVEIARFWAVPDKLVRQDGTIFSAAALEEELAFSIVAILTDGHALTTRHAGADRRLGISRLLRMFARLPRFAFVDFGEGASRASRVARAYGINAVRPDEAAAFLALGRRPEVRDMPAGKLTGDVTAWAAACALSLRPIDEETAYDVRRALGLSVSPWSWALIRRSGRLAGDWVDWPLTKRAELLDWLRRAERGTDTKIVDPNSLLGKTIAYWKNRLDGEALLRSKNDALEPWIGTPAERTLRIDRVFLDLWDQPEEAARILYSFVGTDAEKLVQEKLADFVPLEAEGMRGVIVLPWRFDGLSDASRAMFERLGFGVDASVRQAKLDGDLVERRGRLWMGLGLACGLGVGAIASGIRSWQTATFACVIEDVEGCGGWCEQVENWNGNGARLVAGGLAGFSAQKEAGRTDLPTLRFVRQEVGCEGVNLQGWFALRCGRQVPPEKPERHGDPRRKMFVLQGNPMDERVRSFGKTLLDRGAADVVLMRTEGPGVGELNDWLPLLDLDHDKLVLLRLQDEEVKPQSDNIALKLEQYVAHLPKKTRMWTLSDKPKRVWWDVPTASALTYLGPDNAIEVLADGTTRLRSLTGAGATTHEASTPRYGGQVFTNLIATDSWMSWSPNGQIFITTLDDGKLDMFIVKHLETRELARGIVVVDPVVWNPQSSRFAGISDRGSVLWWSVNETTPHEFPTEKDFVPQALAWSLSGNEIFVGTPQGVTMLVDSQDPISFSVTNQPISSIIGPVAGKYLLISSKAGLVYIVRSDQIARGLPGLELIRELRALTGSLSPDGNYVATVHEGGKIRVATTNDDIAIDEFACDTTIAPDWSSDGRRLLVACGNSVFDRPAFPTIFRIKGVDGVCASRENLEKTFGVRFSEATFINERCTFQ